MSSLNALDTTLQTTRPGAMLALGKNRPADERSERMEAARLGSTVDSEEALSSKVRAVAEDFVSVFMNQVMRSMRATVHENPAMHGDNGEKFFQDLLDTEQAKILAKGSGYGLTDLIYESMMTSYRVTRREDAAAGADSFDERPPAESIDQVPAMAGID